MSTSSGEGQSLSGATMPTSRQRRTFVPVHPTPCGKYTLIAKIGHGGMAEVFLAVASGMAGFRKVSVVKRIHPQLLEEPEFVQMFMDEARLAARLSHPNVVQTHEVGEQDGVPFIAMEYMDGVAYDKLLKAIRRKGTRIPVKLAVRVVMESLAGLHYAHDLRDYDGTALGVVHRDISPSNIFITYQGVVKILDFGIAKATTKLSETRTGQIKGKLSYMAPEQARGKAIDRRADVWSMGVTLFETCTGVRLFKGESDVDTLQRVLTGDINTILKEEEDKLPALLFPIVEKSLARRVEDRFESADVMRKTLAEVLPQLDGPEPDVEGFLREHFEELAESQRAMVGDLLEQADQAAARAAPPVTDDEEEAVPVVVSAPESRNTLRTVLLALLILGGVVGGVAVAMMSSGEPPADDGLATAQPSGVEQEPGDPAAEASEGTAAESAEGARSAEGSPGADAPLAGGGEAAEAGDPAASTAESDGEGGAEGADAEEAAEAAEEVASASDEAAARRLREARRRAAVRRRREQSATDEQASENQQPAAPATAESGTLRLVTRPWSEVYLGGQRIGTTPLLNHRLPAGSHTLVLRNPEMGLEQRMQVRIRPNETTRLNLALQ